MLSPSLFYFIEDFDPDFDYTKGRIVSLHPSVSAELDRRKLNYSILEDFYSEKAIRKGEDEYFSEQIHWISQLDEIVRQHVYECEKWNLSMIWFHYNRFKYLIDDFIIKSRRLLSFIQSVDSCEIIFLGRPAGVEGPPSIYNFERHDRISYLQMLLILAQSQSLKSFKLRFPESIKAPFNLQGKPIGVGSPSLFKMCFKKLGFRKMLNLIRFRKLRKFYSANKQFISKSILFLDMGTRSIDLVISDLVAKGANVYTKNENEIYLLSSLMEGNYNKAHLADASQGSDQNHDWNRAYKAFLGSGFLEWVSNKAGINIDNIIRPYYEHFFKVIAPMVVREFKAMYEFMKDNGIDAVIARASANKNCTAALLAANVLGVKRICFQHSVGPLDLKDWAVDELGFFDVSFAMTTPSKDFFRYYSEILFQKKCQVFESSHYFLSLKKTYDRRKKRDRRISMNEKPSVYYVPAKLAFGLSHFNTMIYPMNWYYEHQKALIRHFSTRSEFDFIYKISTNQKWANESIIPWIKDQGFKNVVIMDQPLPKYLNRISRAIFDYPSTGFFETAACGIPVLALYHESMKVWEPMKTVFKNTLQPFEDTQDALGKIDHFLNSNETQFRVSVPMSEESGLEKLDSILSSLPNRAECVTNI